MYPESGQFSRPDLAIAFAILILAGCGQPSSPSQENSVMADSVAQGTATMVVTPEYAMPYVPKSELVCDTADFASFIRLGPLDDPSPIAVHGLSFPIGDLKLALQGTQICASAPGNITGMLVHYGLDAKMAFDAAVELVCLKPDSGDRYFIGDAITFYRVVQGRLVNQHQDISVWNKSEGQRYADNIVVQLDTDSPYVAFKKGRDVEYTVLRYDGQLDQLIQQNGLSDSDSLTLVPTCVPFRRTEKEGSYFDSGRHQSVCVVPWQVALNDSSYGPGLEYRNKAADYGSPCPPYHVATFPEHGVLRKPGC